MARLTALIVDDERLARRELAYLLQAHPEVEVVGERVRSVEPCPGGSYRIELTGVAEPLRMSRRYGRELRRRFRV